MQSTYMHIHIYGEIFIKFTKDPSASVFADQVDILPAFEL